MNEIKGEEMQTFKRFHYDDGTALPESEQQATLFADRVVFGDGSVATECPWNSSLSLENMLYALDYQPV